MSTVAVTPLERTMSALSLSTRGSIHHDIADQKFPFHGLREISSGGANAPSRQRSLNDLAILASAGLSARLIPRPSSIPTAGSAPLRNRGSVPNLVSGRQSAEHWPQDMHLHPDFYTSLIPVTAHPTWKPPVRIEEAGDLPIPRTVQPATTGPASAFVPMLAITRPDKTGKDFTPMPLASKRVASLKFSPRYHGMHTENNASVEYLKPEQNCALWLTNLPPNVTDRELLGAIRNIGRIYATFINYPDFITHSTSAAKVVFFTPEAAQRLLAHCTMVEPMAIRGYQVKIALNRIKYAKNSMENNESRVLIITGHKSFVNEHALTEYFEARFAFQIDNVKTLVVHENRAVVEYKFGSYRCQSQMGMKALMLDKPQGIEMVEYGADPCEVGSDLTSFTIAGERIQGKGLTMTAGCV